MEVAPVIPLADSWGMHGDDIGLGWVILMGLMMLLMMGGMMWMMMRGMGDRSSSDSSGPDEKPRALESPLAILDRRFAEGAISEEEYRRRREALAEGDR